jgi:hypothetical protein
VLLLATGCKQVLGLDDTKFAFMDAAVDAPSVCDGAPACTSSTGRSVCGQLYQTGASGGQLLRVSAPTGAACTSTGGPCAFTVYGQAATSFYAGTATDRVNGTIDDCGRFVVPDLPATAADVAVVFDATGFTTSASLVIGRMTSPGDDRGVPAFPVATTTLAGWGTETSTTVSYGYLVTQADAMGVPQATEEVWVNGGTVAGPPNPPWSAYFSGGQAFDTASTSATMTDASGTSLVVPAATGSFSLGGKRTGKTCTQVMVQPVAGALIHVNLSC